MPSPHPRSRAARRNRDRLRTNRRVRRSERKKALYEALCVDWRVEATFKVTDRKVRGEVRDLLEQSMAHLAEREPKAAIVGQGVVLSLLVRAPDEPDAKKQAWEEIRSAAAISRKFRFNEMPKLTAESLAEPVFEEREKIPS